MEIVSKKWKYQKRLLF